MSMTTKQSWLQRRARLAAHGTMPNRRVAFAKPVGALPTERTVGVYPSGERYSLRADSDVPCPGGCGYRVCAKRGPCAPVIAPPVERLPDTREVKRVRCVKTYGALTAGREYDVLAPCEGHRFCGVGSFYTVRTDGGLVTFYSREMFEPVDDTPEPSVGERAMGGAR
jgi:hypothetical protein